MRHGILLPLLLVPVLACGDDEAATGPLEPQPDPVPPVATSLVISPGAGTLVAIDDTLRLTAAVRDQDGRLMANAALSWTSLDSTIVAVSLAGVAMAREDGVAQVVARSGTLADTAVLTVEQVPAAVLVAPTTLTLAQGDTARLTAVVVDANGHPVAGAQPGIAWSSDDDTVARIDSTGFVTVDPTAHGLATRIVATADAVAGAAELAVLDRLLFDSQRDGTNQLYMMDADGGRQEPLTVDGGRDGRWSPDGTRVVFWAGRGGVNDIFVIDADGSGEVNVTSDPADDRIPQWLPGGRKVVFYSDPAGNNDVVMANAEATGTQTQLTSDPASDLNPVASPDGSSIAFASLRDGNSEIYLVYADGRQVNLTQDSATDSSPVWSPDGSRIAFLSTRTGDYNIYVMDADGGNVSRLTDTAEGFSPAWSPDGTKIVFRSYHDSNYEIFVMNADGTGLVNLTNDPANDHHPAWSPDGSMIAFERMGDTGYDIWVMNADGSNPVQLTNDPAYEAKPVWQPRRRR